MDLYHFSLYEQLRLDPPVTQTAELREGRRLMEYLEARWARNEQMVGSRWNPRYVRRKV